MQILCEHFQTRSLVLSSICNRIEDASTSFSKVDKLTQIIAVFNGIALITNEQVDDAASLVVQKTEALLVAFEASHPLVPKRKQSAYELELGPIYPEAEVEKWTGILQENSSSRSPNQYIKRSGKKPSLDKIGSPADVAIRTDPSLEDFFTDVHADTSKHGRKPVVRKKALDLLNPT